MDWKDKNCIAKRVIDYYATTPPVMEQIVHTQAVASYTRLIATMEGLEQQQVDLLETAAWLHDIGCPNARIRYGNSRPLYQQSEGQKLVGEWLQGEADLTNNEKEWLVQVVGHHHQRPAALKWHFEPLYDADLIVNIWEGYYAMEKAESQYKKLICTESGKHFFDTFFVENKNQDER